MLFKRIATIFFIALALSAAAQKIQAPQQKDILNAMRQANHSFMDKRADADTVYYEGLMALYSIDPAKEYHDYTTGWAARHRYNDTACFLKTTHGNGRMLAALVRTLSFLPLDDPHRPEYLQDYLDRIKAITPLDTPGYADTAFFAYGMAWGIREGYLDKKQYMPAVINAWNALVTASPDASDGDKLGAFLLAGSEIYQIATPPAANLDETKIPPYQETPIPLTTVKRWESVQRPAIYQLFAKNVYGRMPEISIPVTYTTDAVDTTGIAIKKLITIHFSPVDTGAQLHLMLYLPKQKQKQKTPVFIGYSFTPNDVTDTSSQWPIKEIVSRGYGVAVAWYWDIEPDRADGWQTGIRSQLAAPLHIQPYEWSAMGAWAWGLERIVDYLQTEPKIDTKRLIVIGHSRLGKAAIWAGVSDKRFALVVSNESGEGGAALGKRDYGETIAIINDKFPWWFAPAYKQYGANPAAMPTDQFMLLSLVAPRPLYIASAIGDQWSDPKGEFLSATLAAPVYKLYHEKGVDSGSMPPLEHPVGEYIRYHIRHGKHDMTLYDWQEYMNFADARLGHRTLPAQP
jgi:Glycosyl Hydrolase Family 88